LALCFYLSEYKIRLELPQDPRRKKECVFPGEGISADHQSICRLNKPAQPRGQAGKPQSHVSRKMEEDLL